MSPWSPAEIQAAVPALRKYARVLAQNADEADDLVQLTLLRAYEKARTFKAGARLKPWLLAILHNQFLATVRSDRARRVREATYSSETCANIGGIEHPLNELVADVASAFDALSQSHRSALHLVAIEGLSYREAAEALDVPVGTIMSRLARAREELKRLLERDTSPYLRLIGGKDGQ